MCFLLQTPSGARIVTDPCNMNEDVRADIVTVSHDHVDHNDLSRIIQPYRLITTCGRFEEKGVAILGLPGNHNRGEGGLPNNIYVFAFDGIRLAHSGCQGEPPDQAMLERIGRVDILIVKLTYGAPSTLRPDEAAALARALGAKVVIPAHWEQSRTTLNELAQELGAAEPIMVPGGVMTVSKDELDGIEVPRVMVLDN